MKTRSENWLKDMLEEASREVSEWPEWLREDMQRGARRASASSPRNGTETRVTETTAPRKVRTSANQKTSAD